MKSKHLRKTGGVFDTPWEKANGVSKAGIDPHPSRHWRDSPEPEGVPLCSRRSCQL